MVVKDKDGCLQKFEAEVKAKQCATLLDFVFNPHLGSWKIPSKGSSIGEIIIQDKSGNVSYRKQIDPGQADEWDGRNEAGQLMSAGYYLYTIQYEDGSIEKGSISIMY